MDPDLANDDRKVENNIQRRFSQSTSAIFQKCPICGRFAKRIKCNKTIEFTINRECKYCGRTEDHGNGIIKRRKNG